MGTGDRAARAVLGLAAIVWPFSTGVASTAGIVLSVVLVVTAAVGFCPLYRLMGISTNGARQHAARPVAR